GDALRCLSASHTHTDPGMEHVLTRALGATAELEPFVFEVPVENGDLVLVCSDGVNMALGEPTLAGLVPETATGRQLVQAAHRVATGRPEIKDDASAIFLEVIDRGWRDGTADRPVEVTESLAAGMTIDEFTLERSLQDGGRVWLARQPDGAQEVLKF